MVLKGITVAGEESSEELKDVSVFQFSDGNLYKEEQLTPGQGGQSEISAVSGSRLYFLTGLEIPAGEKAKSEEEFRNTIIGEGLHDNSAPDFMAAVVELESGVVTRSNAEVNVIMKRGVARIDLNTTADSKTQIKEVIVENAPAETLPFLENVRASDKTVMLLEGVLFCIVASKRGYSVCSRAHVLSISSCVEPMVKSLSG